jgi:hypothetical protein
MFGWFVSKPECPVDSQTREWIERRWAWLTEQFGQESLQAVRVILPTAEFFPDSYGGTAADTRVMLDRVCGYMGIGPETVEMSLYQDRNPVYDAEGRRGTAGLYHEEAGKFHVWIEASNLGDPLALVAVMAHELGHVHLLGHDRVSSDADDDEPLADLLTVYLGMGLFTANSVIRENYWQRGNVAGWSMSRRGYLSMPMFGYALARFALARAEEQPPWAKELRPDVRSAFVKARRFLAEMAQDHPTTVPMAPTSLKRSSLINAAGDVDLRKEDPSEAKGIDRLTWAYERASRWVGFCLFTGLMAGAGGLIGGLAGAVLDAGLGSEGVSDRGAFVGAIVFGLFGVWKLR